MADASGVGVWAIFCGNGFYLEVKLVACKKDGSAFLSTKEISKEGIGKSVATAVLTRNNKVELHLRFEGEGACGHGLDGGAEGGGVEDGAVNKGTVALDNFPFEFAVDPLFR